MRQPGTDQPSTNPLPEVPAAWCTVLEGISTIFGRLVYLCSLPDETDRLIRHTSRQVFSRWLALGLAEQIRDLRAYVDANGQPGDYSRLVPPNARDVERRLFLTDMETLAAMLSVAGDSAPPIS
jgi:hypothetical protein